MKVSIFFWPRRIRTYSLPYLSKFTGYILFLKKQKQNWKKENEAVWQNKSKPYFQAIIKWLSDWKTYDLSQSVEIVVNENVSFEKFGHEHDYIDWKYRRWPQNRDKSQIYVVLSIRHFNFLNRIFTLNYLFFIKSNIQNVLLYFLIRKTVIFTNFFQDFSGLLKSWFSIKPFWRLW